jgi:hypothetical protein
MAGDHTPARTEECKSEALVKTNLKSPTVAMSPSLDDGKPDAAISASLEGGDTPGTEQDDKPEGVDQSGVKRAPMEGTSPASRKKKKQTKVVPSLYQKTLGVPEWMSNLTVVNFRRCNILGEETHIRCALYLTIKTCFPFVFKNKEKQWAKLTLAGLNKVLNFYEIIAVQEGKKTKSISKLSEEWPLRMEDLYVQEPENQESINKALDMFGFPTDGDDLSVQTKKKYKHQEESVEFGYKKCKSKKAQSRYRLSYEMPDAAEASKHFKETHYPLWMEAINENNLQSYSELGYVNHVKCALFLIIKHSFKHVYANPYKRWAELTVEGLNQIMNFYETLSARPGPNNQAPGHQFKYCPWREVAWLKIVQPNS